MNAFDIILPIVYIIVGLALVWFVIELVITIRKVRGKAMDTIEELQPTIKNIEGMVEEIQPTITKVDPLVDRVTLTIDGVNLEMMRIDGILEDVSSMTGTLSKTVNTVDSVTSAPVDIVSSITTKVRDKFRPKFASDESVSAGGRMGSTQQNPIAEFADTAIDAAGEAIKERSDKVQVRKEQQQAKDSVREMKNEVMDGESVRLTEAMLDKANQDAPEVPASGSEAPASGQDMEAGPIEEQQVEDAAAAFEGAGIDVPVESLTPEPGATAFEEEPKTASE